MSDSNEPEGHADDLELELSRLGEAEPGVEAHVASCAPCATRRLELAALAASLRGPTTMVPRERDESILAALRQRTTELGRRRRMRGRFVAAVAAAMLAGAVLVGMMIGRRDEEAPIASHAAGAMATRDVNGDGHLDILDAFALARALQAGGATGPDVNGDGSVDRADVDALAAAAVSLDGRT